MVFIREGSSYLTQNNTNNNFYINIKQSELSIESNKLKGLWNSTIGNPKKTAQKVLTGTLFNKLKENLNKKEDGITQGKIIFENQEYKSYNINKFIEKLADQGLSKEQIEDIIIKILDRQNLTKKSTDYIKINLSQSIKGKASSDIPFLNQPEIGLKVTIGKQGYYNEPVIGEVVSKALSKSEAIKLASTYEHAAIVQFDSNDDSILEKDDKYVVVKLETKTVDKKTFEPYNNSLII